MSERSIKSWPLLAFCSLFYAMLSLIFLFMWTPFGSPMLQTLVHSRSTVKELGILGLAAGACTIAAGIWNSKRAKSWLLVLNGVACGVLGAILALGAHRPVAFRTLAILIVVMAATIGTYEFANLPRSRRHGADEWLFAAAGFVAVGFAAVFLGFILGWIKLEPSPSGQTFRWLASYFGFSAICMLGLALGQLRPLALLPGVGHNGLPAR